MADKVPLKAIFTGGVPTALGEYGTGDTIPIIHGGTGATTAGNARTNLGLGDAATKNVGMTAGTVAAGNDSRLSDARTPTAHKTSHATGGSDALTAGDIGAQPADADLTAIAGLSTTGLIERTGAGTAAIVSVTTAGKNLLDDADAAAQRTTLGLGTAATMTGPSGTIVGTTDEQTLTNKTLTDPVIIGTIQEDVYTITDGAAFEIDPGNGSIQLITLGANRTPKGTNFAAGESVTLMVLDGTAYALTWTDTTFGTSGVTWVGGTAPTLNTTKYTVIELWKVGSQVYGALVGAA